MRSAAFGLDASSRMAAMEIAEARQQPLLQEGAEQTDVELAAGAVLAQLIDRADQLVQATLHAGQQARALWRESHSPAVADEQWRLQVSFERLDVGADGGGGDLQRLCGTGEAQVRRDRLECAQCIQWEFDCVSHCSL